MKKSRYTEEQIIGILKQHEAGVKTAELCREHGISAATFYGWKSKYGGMYVNGHVESFHGRLRDECLNASWFRTLNDVRSTLANWRQEYNSEHPHSSLGYQTPEQFRQSAGYANVQGQEPLPHLHSHDGGYGIFPKPNLNRESPVMNG